MNIKTLASGTIAALLTVPAMAQNTSNATLDELRQEVDRLQSEVEYLKESAKGARKEAAMEAVAVDTLKTTTSKFTWSGDLRYRHEEIDTEGNVTNRNRDRARVRFGVLAKVNDAISAKLQLSTVNVGGDNARSTNQTLGNGTAGNGAWDLAYVEWRPFAPLTIQLGKTPMPWTRTSSYFWDGDLTPEGGNLKFARGIFFGDVAYNLLSEQDSGNNTSLGIARHRQHSGVGATRRESAPRQVDLDRRGRILRSASCAGSAGHCGRYGLRDLRRGESAVRRQSVRQHHL